MRSKTRILLWFITALLMLYSPVFSQQKPKDKFTKPNHSVQDPLEKWSEEKVLEHLGDPVSPGGYSEYLCCDLHRFAERAAALKSEKIVKRILDLAEVEECITEVKLTSLALFKDSPGVHDYVVKSLSMQSSAIQATAAATLLKWGEWDLAAPVVCRNEAFIIFSQPKDERAIPWLEKAVINGTWYGRITAAEVLYHIYGDSTKSPQVALDIILHAPINTTDENTNRAKYEALALAPKLNPTEALPGLIRLSQDTYGGISKVAVKNLLHFSDLGYQEATQALIDIRDHHSNASIREQVKQGILKIEQKQK